MAVFGQTVNIFHLIVAEKLEGMILIDFCQFFFCLNFTFSISCIV